MGAAGSIRLPEDIKEGLDKLSKRTGRSKTYYITQAIYEKLEDLEDLYLAEQILIDIHEGRSRTYTLAEVEEQLGLVD